MVGILSLILLAIAVLGIYVFKSAGPWRWIFIIAATAALWFDAFVGVIHFALVPLAVMPRFRPVAWLMYPKFEPAQRDMPKSLLGGWLMPSIMFPQRGENENASVATSPITRVDTFRFLRTIRFARIDMNEPRVPDGIYSDDRAREAHRCKMASLLALAGVDSGRRSRESGSVLFWRNGTLDRFGRFGRLPASTQVAGAGEMSRYEPLASFIKS